MLQTGLREEIGRILPAEQIRYDEPMAAHCSFRTGGPADALVSVRTGEELGALLALLRAEGMAYFLLGKGTNLLIGDGGFRGVIVTTVDPGKEAAAAGAGKTSGAIETAGGSITAPGTGRARSAETTAAPGEEAEPFFLNSVRVQGNRITAGAGATLKAVAVAAMEHGLEGMEFAAGIPGTVGGGLVMNAGAYGGEMRQVVRKVGLLMPDGTMRDCSGEEMEFGYRTSLLRRIPAAALRAEFELTPGDPETIRAKIADLAAQRRAKQPLEYPSAGSTFKRPEGYFAGKLIMDAGLAGYSIGGAQVSEKHCGFVINRGGATSAQIRALIEDVQQKVCEAAGVRLEREEIFHGEF